MLSISNWRISFFYFHSENDLRDCSSRRISRHLSSRYYYIPPAMRLKIFCSSRWNFFRNDNKKIPSKNVVWKLENIVQWNKWLDYSNFLFFPLSNSKSVSWNAFATCSAILSSIHIFVLILFYFLFFEISMLLSKRQRMRPCHRFLFLKKNNKKK